MAQRIGMSIRPVSDIHVAPSASIADPYSQRFTFGTGFDRGNNKENFGLRGSTDLSPIDSEEEGEEDESFSPINARTWAREPTASFSQGGTFVQPSSLRKPLPLSSTLHALLKDSEDLPQTQTQTQAQTRFEPKPPPPPPPHASTEIMTSSQGFAPECDHFLEMMEEKLRIGARRQSRTEAAIEACASSACHDLEGQPHVRSASSSYPSPGDTCTRVQSPDSMVRQNRLSVTDLARITQANGRLSVLRSSSSLSEQQQYLQHQRNDAQDRAFSRGHRGDVLRESSSAIAQWETELRQRPSSYSRYELADSAEVLPSEPYDPGSGHKDVFSTPYGRLASQTLTWENLQAIRAQYDGTQDLTHPALRPENPHFSSPSPDAVPSSYPRSHEARTHTQGGEDDLQGGGNGSNKRKASYFSLRSLSLKSLTKRPRLGLRRWANSVYEQGSHRLRVARQKFREQADVDRRAFEAWRARRRRRRRGEDFGCTDDKHDKDKQDRNDEDKGKTKRLPPSWSCGGEAFPQRKNEEWWRDGVSRFEAHKWMGFLPGPNSAPSLRA